MKCKGCNESKKLIDAHIIPKSFFMDLKGDANHLAIVDSSRNGRLGRTFKGDYDKNILCKSCDGKFELFDDYAKKLLVGKEKEFVKVYHNFEHIGWEVEYDYYKIRYFLLSVLWRASISERSFYNKINLGPHQDIIKNEIFNLNNSFSNNYQFMISRFTPDRIQNLEKTILCPYTTQIEGVEFCVIMFLGYMAWVKVDIKPEPIELTSFMARNGEPLKIIARSFEDSKQKKIIIDTHSKLNA